MIKYQKDVLEFRRACDLPIGDFDRPGFFAAERQTQSALILEEFEEIIEADKNGDRLERIDGIVDVSYFVDGSCCVGGIEMPAVGWRRGVMPTSFQSAVMIFLEALRNGSTPEAIGAIATLVMRNAILDFAYDGLDFRAHWDEVHRCNMAKLGGERRADGKLLKPVGWTPPDHARVWREMYGTEPPAAIGT